MARVKFTGLMLQNLKPKQGGGRRDYFDANYAGLCLRVGARDKTWAYFYRFDGKQVKETLGKYAPGHVHHMSHKDAKDRADQINLNIQDGKDPRTQKVPVKKKATSINPNTFKRRVDEFITYYETSGKKPATVIQAKKMLLSQRLDDWHSTDVTNISRPELVTLLEGMDETPVMANRIHAWLDVLFIWCADHGHLTPPWPTYKLKKRFKELPRKRSLSQEEIKALWLHCVELGYPYGDWCRFLLVTGQRPGECRKLNRDHINGRVWLVEGGNPKNSETHKLPIMPLAAKIIKAVPDQSGPFVFSTTDGLKPIGQGGKVTTLINDTEDITEHFQFRDLRRTFNTIASEELGVADHILGAVCNHMSRKRPGMARVYNSAEYMKGKRKALKKWNDWLLKAVKDG